MPGLTVEGWASFIIQLFVFATVHESQNSYLKTLSNENKINFLLHRLKLLLIKLIKDWKDAELAKETKNPQR